MVQQTESIACTFLSPVTWNWSSLWLRVKYKTYQGKHHCSCWYRRFEWVHSLFPRSTTLRIELNGTIHNIRNKKISTVELISLISHHNSLTFLHSICLIGGYVCYCVERSGQLIARRSGRESTWTIRIDIGRILKLTIDYRGLITIRSLPIGIARAHSRRIL